MNGALLKTRLQTIESNLSETARKLNMSKQAFYQMLEAADVKSGIIERLATLYNRPVGFFFDDKVENVSNIQNGNGIQQYAGRDAYNAMNPAEHDELIRLRVEVKMFQERLEEAQKAYEHLQKSYAHLQKMNEFLMGNK